MANDAETSKAVAEKALNSFIDGVKKTLKKGKKVTLVGFGTFSISKRKARKGRNPRTGETITIKAAKVPKFTAGKALKDAIK
jgi:DNA-binding protein HU-beta